MTVKHKESLLMDPWEDFSIQGQQHTKRPHHKLNGLMKANSKSCSHRAREYDLLICTYMQALTQSSQSSMQSG